MLYVFSASPNFFQVGFDEQACNQIDTYLLLGRHIVYNDIHVCIQIKYEQASALEKVEIVREADATEAKAKADNAAAAKAAAEKAVCLSAEADAAAAKAQAEKVAAAEKAARPRRPMQQRPRQGRCRKMPPKKLLLRESFVVHQTRGIQ